MTKSYNGIESTSVQILTLTDVPNILKVTDDPGGTHAVISIAVGVNSQTVSADSQFSITVLDETITNVTNIKEANNRFFYVSNQHTTTAYSIYKALCNCSSLVADWNIRVMTNIPNVSVVQLTSRAIGSHLAGVTAVTTNLSCISTTTTDGTAYSPLNGSQVFCDIFDDGTYLTTLEKSFYGGEVAFNVSPVLETISEYGRTEPYSMNMYAVLTGGTISQLGTASGLTTVGYLANNSDKFLYLGSGTRLLRNDGNLGGVETTWGIYDLSEIPMSILLGENSGGYSYTMTLYDSIGSAITSWTSSQQVYGSKIRDITESVPQALRETTFRIGVTVGSQQEETFRVIKPLRMADRWVRIHWRNEYGGISFFDFTGGIDESEDIDTDTYSPSVYNLYERQEHYGEKDYRRTVTKSVTAKAHLMTLGEKYPLESLARSKRSWIKVGQENHLVSVTDITIERDDNYDDTYNAKVTFKPTEVF